ncbi:MAG: peptidylprolyl isomerase [Magnetospirillum sp.]|nr:peptidylprolyl isomerase [Magnetospirillum sp.]
MLQRLAVCLFAVIALVGARPACAQEIDRIAAVVNDEIISNKDLDERVHMAIVLSHLPQNQDTLRRVVPQVLRKMIDEHLQTQEAKRLKIGLTPQEIDQGIASIERQNNMPKGSMMRQMKQAGVEPSLVRQQIAADLLWYKVAAGVLQPTIRIGDEEIEDRLEAIKARQGKPEYLVSEIFLPVDNPSQDSQMHTLGERLIEQLHEGAPFAVLANQFSQSPTAANGGSMGWVSEGMIDDDLLRAISGLTPNHISPLVRTADGYHIIALADRRIAGASPNNTDTIVTLSHMILPLPKNGPPKEQLMAKAAQMTQSANSCDAFEAMGHQVGALDVRRIGPSKVGELTGMLRRASTVLQVGGVSPPLEIPNGLEVIMLCTRKETAPTTLPSHDQIRRMIEDERMDMLTRRYLRDLRRQAFIDIRM